MGGWQLIIAICCLVVGLPGAIHDSLQIRAQWKAKIPASGEGGMKLSFLRAYGWPVFRWTASLVLMTVGILLLTHRIKSSISAQVGPPPTVSPVASPANPGPSTAPGKPHSANKGRPKSRQSPPSAPTPSVTQDGHNNQQNVAQAPITQINTAPCTQQVGVGSNNSNGCTFGAQSPPPEISVRSYSSQK
jgi:hypothetical protein